MKTSLIKEYRAALGFIFKEFKKRLWLNFIAATVDDSSKKEKIPIAIPQFDMGTELEYWKFSVFYAL